MAMSVINTLLDTQEFATLPPVAAKVLEMLENDDTDIREISRVVEADAPLTIKLLRVANSPLYATRNEVKSIHQAIITLGLNRLTNIVLGVSIFSKFLVSSQKSAKELMEKFWWHSSCAGMVAKSFSKKINKYFKETEFIGGLLHDIGKLAMIQYDSIKYLEVIRLVIEENMNDNDAENQIFGVTHAEVGAEISRLWKLPAELRSVITFHDRIEDAFEHKELISMVRLADLLCEVWGAGFYEGITELFLKDESGWHVLCDSFPELLQLDVERFTFELEEDYKMSSSFLNIILGESN